MTLYDDALRLRALLARTTPGRWHLKLHGEGGILEEPQGFGGEASVTFTLIGATAADARFVAHARADAAYVIGLFRGGSAVGDAERGQLDGILDRCRHAAPPPWTSFVEDRDHVSGSDVIVRDTDDPEHDDLEIVGASAADLDFIAAARHDLVQIARRLSCHPHALHALPG
jgi:hypothetical protein